MYSGTVWPPFSAAYGVAVSGPSPLTLYPPTAPVPGLRCLHHVWPGASPRDSRDPWPAAAPNLGSVSMLISGPELPAPQACQPKFASHPAPPTSLAWPALSPAAQSCLWTQTGPAPHLWV